MSIMEANQSGCFCLNQNFQDLEARHYIQFFGTSVEILPFPWTIFEVSNWAEFSTGDVSGVPHRVGTPSHLFLDLMSNHVIVA